MLLVVFGSGNKQEPVKAQEVSVTVVLANNSCNNYKLLHMTLIPTGILDAQLAFRFLSLSVYFEPTSD